MSGQVVRPFLFANLDLHSHMEETVQNALQNSSGGNFDNFIHKEFSGKIPYSATLAIKMLVG